MMTSAFQAKKRTGQKKSEYIKDSFISAYYPCTLLLQEKRTRNRLVWNQRGHYRHRRGN